METLPDYLQPGLDIVLVGLNPSTPSARTGHYFANPRNRFWPAFNGAELTPEPLTAETDYRVLEFGIGMTDIVKRPTPGVADLKTADFHGGVLDLQDWPPILEHRHIQGLRRPQPQPCKRVVQLERHH